MLRLILGPTHQANTDMVLSQIICAAGKGVTGQYIIVPEQFSFEMEQLLCRRGGDSISRSAEVLSFTRLADRVESIYGGGGRLWLDKGGRLLAAAQAVEQVHSRLKLFASVSRKPEFLEMFLAAADEFGGYGVTSELLSAAAARFAGQFSLKIQELCLLYESYLSVCAQAQDPIVRLQNLRDVLSREDFACGKRFYICLFHDLTPLEKEIVENLILSADCVTVALPGEISAGAQVFPLSSAAADDLKKFCHRNNRNVTVEYSAFSDGAPEDLRYLQKHITDFASKPMQCENVFFRQLNTPEEECRHAAAQIRKLVQSGARYRDIAVACADMTGYGPIISRVFRRAGIPYFSSGKTPLTELAGVTAVLSALRAAAFGLEKADVIAYLKTGFADISQDACDRIENYARMWNVHGAGWLQPWTWHPHGVGFDWTDRDSAVLNDLNAWKNAAIAPLQQLRRDLRESSSVGEQAQSLFSFFTRCRLGDRLQETADRLFEQADYKRAQQYTQIYDTLVDALEQMSLVMSGAVRTPEEFYFLFEKLLSQYSAGAVPATLDEVVVGSIGAFRAKTSDHLLILGAGDGKFPNCVQSSGMFTEAERQLLLSAGVSMAPLRSDLVERELGEIYMVIRSAGQSLYISCTETPSYLFTRTAAIVGQKLEIPGTPVVLDRYELAAALLRNAMPAGDAAQEELEFLQKKREYSFGAVERERVERIYGSEIRLSASKIDLFAACRFAFFMRYGLKAEVRKAAQFDASAFGTFVHAVLEKTGQKVMEAGGFTAVDEETLIRIADSVMEEYAGEVLSDLLEQDPKFRYVFRRNREEAMAVVRDLGAELRISDFVPARFELNFSDDGDMPPIRVEGEHAASVLTGFVDRVDLYKRGDATYVRVVDYKTGHKDFDYTDISIGAGMQMLIYLFALTHAGEKLFGGKLQPAGVLYHPAREDVIAANSRPTAEEAAKEQQKARMRKGLVVNNDVVLHAMEHYKDTPVYLPFNEKKNVRRGDLADSVQMKLLENHVFEALRRITDEICSGDVDPNPVVRGPMNSACTYCDYRQACHKDLLRQNSRVLRKISNAEFWKELEGKAHG